MDERTRSPTPPTPPTGEQKQKQRTNDVLPKPAKSISYRHWEFLAIVVGIACDYMGIAAAADRQGRVNVIRTQILHWLAFLVAMNILLLPPVQQLLPTPATGLAMMLLLALGTFVAGIYVSTDIALLGLAMALSVPAIAWLKVSALLLLLVGFAIIGLAVAWRRR